MSFMAELHVGPPGERRRSTRRSGAARATVRTPGAGAVPVLVHDISQHGFRATIALDLAIGAEVRLALAGPNPFPAVIVWREEQHYGCAFRTPISAVAIADAFSGRMVIE